MFNLSEKEYIYYEKIVKEIESRTGESLNASLSTAIKIFVICYSIMHGLE